MKTKNLYKAPTMKVVEIESLTLLAGSGDMNVSATIYGRGTSEDLEDDE